MMTRRDTRTGFLGGAALAVAMLVFTPGGVQAEQPGWRGEATLGVDLYRTGEPLGSKLNSTGFFDQYRYLFKKNNVAAVFGDLTDVNLGYVREDGTYLVRLVRQSPNWLNDRTRVLVDLPGQLLVDVHFRNYRRDNLREYPQISPVGATSSKFGTQYNDDTSPTTRFWRRRTGVSGQIRILPGLLGLGEESILRSLTFGAGVEQRSGERQFRYMLSGGADRISGATDDFFRWRGIAQDIDHKIFSPQGEAVLAFAGFTGVARVAYERFSAREQELTNTKLAGSPLGGSGIQTSGTSGLNTTNFLPTTDRFSTSVKLARRFGDRAGMRMSGQWGTLKQEHFSALEKTLMFGRNRIYNFGGAVAGDVRLSDSLSLNAFGKIHVRDNDSSPISRVDTPTDERIDRRSEWNLGVELNHANRHGNWAAGYKIKTVNRDLNFADATSSERILKHNASLQDETQLQTWYLNSRCRPVRGLQARTRVHYTRGSHVGLPTDPKSEYGVRGRVSWVPNGQPLVISTFGHLRQSQNREFEYVGETAGTRSHDVKNTSWMVGMDVTGTPTEGASLFLSTMLQEDSASNDFVRATARRFMEPTATVLDFYYDSTPLQYQSKVFSLSLGGTLKPTKKVDLTAAYTFNRANLGVDGGSATTDILDDFTEVNSDVHRVQLGAGLQVNRSVRVGASYEYNDYGDGRTVVSGARSLSEHEHIVGMRFTYRFQPPSAKK